MSARKRLVLLFLLSALLLLCGCAKSVELSSGEVKDDIQSITAVVTPEDLALLDKFERLVSADFSGSICYAELMDWADAHPLTETRYTVPFPGGVTAENNVESLDLSGLSDKDAETALERLQWLPKLKSVDLGSEKTGLSPQSVLLFKDRYPDLRFGYHCTLLGKDSALDEKSLDLRETSPSDIRKALDTISCLRELKTIRLGSDAREDGLSWEDILALREAAPEAKIDYSFTLYDLVPLTLEDEEINLDYIRIYDNGAEVLAAARCMRNLRSLQRDSCGISNPDMAVIRDALPNAEVVWRINFAVTYSAKTDVIKILASSPSWGGRALNYQDLDSLKYFTKLKYLDIGHNDSDLDLSFLQYLPDLEVLIIACNEPLRDISPVAFCEKLEYLELFYTDIDDLSPLSGLKNLRHLNIGHCPRLTDISPVYDLDLERFYLGSPNFTPVPQEQVDHYRELHPDCEVDNEYWESSTTGWRYKTLEGDELAWYQQQPYYREDRINLAPRYALLRDQMGYDTLDYTVRWNDPSYQYVNYTW